MGIFDISINVAAFCEGSIRNGRLKVEKNVKFFLFLGIVGAWILERQRAFSHLLTSWDTFDIAEVL